MLNYLPILSGSTVKYIYSGNATFPVSELLGAKTLLEGGEYSGLSFDNNGNIMSSKCNASWSVPDIALALRAYEISESTGIYYMPIYDTYGFWRLLVSKKFDGHKRILVDSVRMTSVVVEDNYLADRLADLIYDKTPGYILSDIYKAVEKASSGKGDFLDAVVVNRGGNSDSATPEYVAMSPLKTKYYDNVRFMYMNELHEYAGAAVGNGTEDVYMKNNTVQHRLLTFWRPMSAKYLKYVLETVRRTYASKSDYYAVYSDVTGDPLLYVSTDYRHLVKATTLEHIAVSNVYLLNQLKEVCRKGEASMDSVHDIWDLAAKSVYDYAKKKRRQRR